MIVRHRTFAFAALCAAALFVGSAAADVGDTLREQCHVQLNLPDSACDCIAERGTSELSPQQQELLVAMVLKDQQASAAARADLTTAEITETGVWMANAPQQCMAQ